MVRVFPAQSLTAVGWPRAHSQGYQATLDLETGKVQAFNYATPNYTRFPLVCKRTHESHSFGVFYGQNPMKYSFNVMMFEVVFVILVTRIIRFLLKPLKQPRVVSEIIGGIIVGPSILGRSRGFQERVFPDNANFVVKNIGVMGFMFYLFLNGVKVDVSLVRKSGKKQFYIAMVGVLVPCVVVNILGIISRSSMDKELAKPSSIGAVAGSASITAFTVLHPILKEWNLLSSEVGRMALSISLLGDGVGLFYVAIFEACKHGEVNGRNVLWYTISLLILMAFMFTTVRPAMTWIIAKTPEGEAVDQAYVVGILLTVFVIAFFTDMFGIAIANGPLYLGLIIPDGPPLGATLVQRSETIIMEILMPFSFACVGLYSDVFAMSDAGWSVLAPLFAMTVTGYITKLLSTLVAAVFFQLPFKDALALSLIMSLRGQAELLLFLHWMDKRIIKEPAFTMMVLLTTAITATVSPFISILYDPSKPYMVNKRRTIQHTPPDSDLRIVLCVHDQKHVPSLIKLLDVSYPTLTSPFVIYALHLIELLGSATPVFIDHEKQEEPSKYGCYETIHNALKRYQESRDEFVKLHSFTSWTTKRTMYQDICKLALEKKAAIIILPFQKEVDDSIATTTEVARGGIQSINLKVLSHAPCSVGIFVDKAHLRNPFMARSFRGSVHNIVLLFLGGKDAREALAYSERVAANPDVSLTVIRFLAHNHEGDDEMEKKLDDGVVTSFWVKNEANERVVYREVVVKNGAETMAAIQAMNDGMHDLWIMGRKNGINPVLLEGLSAWGENSEELGLLGDYIASDDFGGSASVLVVQKQVLRGQGVETIDDIPAKCARRSILVCV